MRFICLSFFLLVENCTAWRNATIGHNYDMFTEINASIWYSSRHAYKYFPYVLDIS